MEAREIRLEKSIDNLINYIKIFGLFLRFIEILLKPLLGVELIKIPDFRLANLK